MMEALKPKPIVLGKNKNCNAFTENFGSFDEFWENLMGDPDTERALWICSKSTMGVFSGDGWRR